MKSTQMYSLIRQLEEYNIHMAPQQIQCILNTLIATIPLPPNYNKASIGRHPLRWGEWLQILNGQTATYFDNAADRANNGEVHRNILSCAIYNQYQPSRSPETESAAVSELQSCGLVSRREVRIIARLAFGEPNFARINQYWSESVPEVVQDLKVAAGLEFILKQLEPTRQLVEQYQIYRKQEIARSGGDEQHLQQIFGQADMIAAALTNLPNVVNTSEMIADGMIDDLTDNPQPKYPGHTIDADVLRQYTAPGNPLTINFGHRIEQLPSGDIDVGADTRAILVDRYGIAAEHFQRIDDQTCPPALQFQQSKALDTEIVKLSRELIAAYTMAIMHIMVGTELNQSMNIIHNSASVVLYVQTIWERAGQLATPELIRRMFLNASMQVMGRPEQYMA